jgi:hypothetical protein
MRGFLVVLITSWVVVGALAAPVPKELKKKKTYFPLATGTKWEYVNEDGSEAHSREISAVTEKDGVRTVAVLYRDRNFTMTWELREDATGLYRSKYENAAVDPPQLLMKPTMTEGDEWECRFNQGRQKCHYIRTVSKAEKVTTPAGEYTAIPIKQVDPDDPDDTATIWYAEGVGMVKLQEGGAPAILLKAMTPGNDGK